MFNKRLLFFKAVHFLQHIPYICKSPNTSMIVGPVISDMAPHEKKPLQSSVDIEEYDQDHIQSHEVISL